MNEIKLTINGRQATLQPDCTLLELLESRRIPPDAVVVEHNKTIIPKGHYAEIKFSDGDTLEIVQIIGGG